jgi:ABC-type glycerol-3-phosphate transport system substrate-binding protein
MTVDYVMTPTNQFPNRLDPVLAAGIGVPDVFALESSFVRKYVESGLLLDLTDIYNEVRDKVLAYPVEIGSYNGRVYAMSWEATPGAMFYRRSLARQYLGTDDPVAVQRYFNNWNSFVTTAGLLRERSGGKCVVISSLGDLGNPFASARAQPWVVNGQLYIDPAVNERMTLSKTLRDRQLEGRVGAWSEGWFAGMNGTMHDEAGNPVEVFSYFLPTWGLHYVLKQNAPNTAGDWAMIQGPAVYWWGGTWIGAYSGTRNPQAAREMIKFLTTNDAMLESYARESGDFVSNMYVVNKIKDTFSEPFLGGQNHYSQFAEMAIHVDGSLAQGTDQAINALFDEALTQYVNDEKSREQAIADFRDQVSATLGF